MKLTHHLVSRGTDAVGVTGQWGGLWWRRDVGSVPGFGDGSRPGKWAWLVGRRGRRSDGPRAIVGASGGRRGVRRCRGVRRWGVRALLVHAGLAVRCGLRGRAGLCRRLWRRMAGRLDWGLVTGVAPGCSAWLWGGRGGRGGRVAGQGSGGGAEGLGWAWGGGGVVHWIAGVAGRRVCGFGRGRSLLLGTWKLTEDLVIIGVKKNKKTRTNIFSDSICGT